MVSEEVCGWLPPNPNKNVWEEQLKCEWTDWLRNQMWDIPYYENKKSLRTLFLASTPAETADWTPIPTQSYFSPWEPQSYLVLVPVSPKWAGLNITVPQNPMVCHHVSHWNFHIFAEIGIFGPIFHRSKQLPSLPTRRFQRTDTAGRFNQGLIRWFFFPETMRLNQL